MPRSTTELQRHRNGGSVGKVNHVGVVLRSCTTRVHNGGNALGGRERLAKRLKRGSRGGEGKERTREKEKRTNKHPERNKHPMRLRRGRSRGGLLRRGRSRGGRLRRGRSRGGRLSRAKGWVSVATWFWRWNPLLLSRKNITHKRRGGPVVARGPQLGAARSQAVGLGGGHKSKWGCRVPGPVGALGRPSPTRIDQTRRARACRVRYISTRQGAQVKVHRGKKKAVGALPINATLLPRPPSRPAAHPSPPPLPRPAAHPSPPPCPFLPLPPVSYSTCPTRVVRYSTASASLPSRTRHHASPCLCVSPEKRRRTCCCAGCWCRQRPVHPLCLAPSPEPSPHHGS